MVRRQNRKAVAQLRDGSASVGGALHVQLIEISEQTDGFLTAAQLVKETGVREHALEDHDTLD